MRPIINRVKNEFSDTRIIEEEKYDGYYSIVTSELEMTDFEMRNIYRGLAKIEDTFKISKTEFDSRPVFVRTNPHIDAHFTTCFTALVLIRLLQIKLSNKFPVGQIIQALKSYSCIPVDINTYQFIYYDEILKFKKFSIRYTEKSLQPCIYESCSDFASKLEFYLINLIS